MGRVGGALFLGSCVVAVVSILSPYSPQAYIPGFWALAVATAVIATVLLGWTERLPDWSFQVVTVLASAMVALSLYFNGERLGGPAAMNEVYYLCVALYAGYFFTRRAIAFQLSVSAATYAVALAAIHPGPIAFTRWFITMGMVAAAASMVHVLKSRNEQLVTRLTEAARSDWLTRLLNRQGYEERFELEFEWALRTEQPLVIVVGDLDRLKAINDRWGHAAGDAALIEIGRLLDGACRKIDTAARIGGDEFALLLPATDTQGAHEFAERLRSQLASLPVHDGAPLTMSFGIVEFPLHGATRETLMHAADQTLYRAKQLGRDRSTIESRPPLEVA